MFLLVAATLVHDMWSLLLMVLLQEDVSSVLCVCGWFDDIYCGDSLSLMMMMMNTFVCGFLVGR